LFWQKGQLITTLRLLEHLACQAMTCELERSCMFRIEQPTVLQISILEKLAFYIPA
jgi:hypothetical protein